MILMSIFFVKTILCMKKLFASVSRKQSFIVLNKESYTVIFKLIPWHISSFFLEKYSNLYYWETLNE